MTPESLSIAVLAAAITIAGIVILTVVPNSSESKRISDRRTRQLQAKARELGYKGTITAVGSYEKGEFHFGINYSPDQSDPKDVALTMDAAKLAEPFQSLPFRYLWVNRNLIIIGMVLAILGVILALVSQVLS